MDDEKKEGAAIAQNPPTEQPQPVEQPATIPPATPEAPAIVKRGRGRPKKIRPPGWKPLRKTYAKRYVARVRGVEEDAWGLTWKEKRFCLLYVVNGIAHKAARAAGYAQNVGRLLLQKPKIKAFINELLSHEIDHIYASRRMRERELSIIAVAGREVNRIHAIDVLNKMDSLYEQHHTINIVANLPKEQVLLRAAEELRAAGFTVIAPSDTKLIEATNPIETISREHMHSFRLPDAEHEDRTPDGTNLKDLDGDKELPVESGLTDKDSTDSAE